MNSDCVCVRVHVCMHVCLCVYLCVHMNACDAYMNHCSKMMLLLRHEYSIQSDMMLLVRHKYSIQSDMMLLVRYRSTGVDHGTLQQLGNPDTFM